MRDVRKHAPIIDGARPSRARIVNVSHLDAGTVARALRARHAGRTFVVTESCFSGDAEPPDLQALRRIGNEHAAPIADEPNALGVLGSEGRGLCADQCVRAEATVSTSGKAFGAGSAFVASGASFGTWLWAPSRSFVFSTALSPVVVAVALEGLRGANVEPWRRERVLRAPMERRQGLTILGADLRRAGSVIPWIIGEAGGATNLATALQKWGIEGRAIRPPSVPARTALPRFTVTAANTNHNISRTVEGVAACLQEGSGCAGA